MTPDPARTAGVEAVRRAKLTGSQAEFLRQIARSGRQYVIAGYKPAVRLRDLGYAVVIDTTIRPYPWGVEITDVGRAALAPTPIKDHDHVG